MSKEEWTQYSYSDFKNTKYRYWCSEKIGADIYSSILEFMHKVGAGTVCTEDVQKLKLCTFLCNAPSSSEGLGDFVCDLCLDKLFSVQERGAGDKWDILLF
jgi:hypothetical protein